MILTVFTLLIVLVYLEVTPVDIIFSEDFEDTDFTSREWYDFSNPGILSDDSIRGSHSFQCVYSQGTTGCRDGRPARRLFPDSESVFMSVWLKYSENFVGSQRNYHPHEFHFVTNVDSKWVGYANTHLTLYIEQVGGTPHLALQDSLNNDNACILLNNDNFVGCNGDFDTYEFTEERSVAACNGAVGDIPSRDCFNAGSYYYSSRLWSAGKQCFSDTPGDFYKNDWHKVSAYFEMNSIVDGVGLVDGKMKYWFDDELLVSYDQVLYRTGANPTMLFNQFAIAPYIGDGSPVEQFFLIDDLVVAKSFLDSEESDDTSENSDDTNENSDDTNEVSNAGSSRWKNENFLAFVLLYFCIYLIM